MRGKVLQVLDGSGARGPLDNHVEELAGPKRTQTGDADLLPLLHVVEADIQMIVRLRFRVRGLEDGQNLHHQAGKDVLDPVSQVLHDQRRPFPLPSVRGSDELGHHVIHHDGKHRLRPVPTQPHRLETLEQGQQTLPSRRDLRVFALCHHPESGFFGCLFAPDAVRSGISSVEIHTILTHLRFSFSFLAGNVHSQNDKHLLGQLPDQQLRGPVPRQ
ncbi:hypothetical protein VTN02DRAFT_3786 [Thermoascus thermophilus]